MTESVLEQGVQDSLLSVKTVLRLIENDALRSIHDLSGDLLLAVCGETVHDDTVRLCEGEELLVDRGRS